MPTYCEFAPGNPIHGPYHDHEYGFPLTDDNQLFERLMLEVNQAGLSWEIILKRRAGMHEAYNGWDITTVANYTEDDRARLLADPRIIRNRLKVNAAIENARRVQEIQQEFGSFHAWLLQLHPMTLEAWVKRLRKEFRFMGKEVVNEFLMSIGFLPGAHHDGCPVYAEIAQLSPVWMQSQ